MQCAQTASANSTLWLCTGHENAFFIPPLELLSSIDLYIDMNLVCFYDEFFVLWNWVVMPEVVSVPESLPVDDSEIQHVI